MIKNGYSANIDNLLLICWPHDNKKNEIKVWWSGQVLFWSEDKKIVTIYCSHNCHLIYKVVQMSLNKNIFSCFFMLPSWSSFYKEDKMTYQYSNFQVPCISSKNNKNKEMQQTVFQRAFASHVKILTKIVYTCIIW